jgi:pSer/pThr/pTyr-binding forkhead associated (FHA) protein
MPPSPGDQPSSGLRASDAERDQVVARLRDEFVAGRLSHDTFLHRVGAVLQSRRRSDLPALVADLPAQPPPRSLADWLRGTWHRVTGASRSAADPSGAGQLPAAPSPAVRRAATTNLPQAPARTEPYQLQFPRGVGSSFSIGRDANCDLAISDMSVSRRHAQLDRTPDGWLLSDLSSTNGTRLNGWRVRGQVPVRPGDLVRFGDLEVFFLSGDDPAA